MTRPEIVRADTLDLQDTSTPSAKDHSRQPASPKPLGDGPPAPHQAQTLRKASLDGYDLHVRSPRASKDLSDKELQLLHDVESDDQDAAGEDHLSAGGQEVVGNDIGIDEDDDDLDDDMMDKISSSPSIDDGGYIAPVKWPCRKDSLLQLREKIGAEEMSFEPEKPHQLQRTTSNLRYELCTMESPSSDSDNTPTESPNRLIPERPVFPCSRFKENLDEPGLESYESGSEHMNGHLGDDGSNPDDPLFELHSGDQIPYELEITVNDISDVGDGDSWREDGTGDFDEEPLWTNIDDRFVDSGWGGECLRELEDIDFEFVYALHTFVATVEGQANATKGDTMVLLDDSNSYWWLVKIVKDSSIGYLPAEHIETPTERLARLNKHRNIDLSQTMLGDNPEKSRNPLKKAMRRRNAKTVQFAEPQYFEPSEPSYSSDEEDDEMSPTERAAAQAAEAQAQAQNQQAQQQQSTDDQAAVVEPLRTQKQQTNGVDDSPTKEGANGQYGERDQPRPSTESMESEGGTGWRRIRNTESFYKDDTVETRKISLTPNILKEDGSTAAPAQETKQESRTSLDSLKDSLKSGEKSPASTEKEKPKDKKKKKGVLGGLFTRKNSKKQDKEKEERDDLSGTTAVSTLQSNDSASIDSSIASPTAPTTAQAPQQKHGKLQKAPPTKTASILKRTPAEERTDGQSNGTDTAAIEPSRALSPSAAGQGPDSALTPAPLQARPENASIRPVPQETTRATEPISQLNGSRGIFSPVKTMLGGSSSSEPKEPKPEKVKKAKNRMALEDSETSEDDTPTPQQSSVVSNLSNALRPAPEPVDTAGAAKQQRLSESPVEVSPVLQTQLHPAHASGSTADAPPSPLSANSTPELVDHPSESELSHPNARHLQQGPVVTKTPEAHATPSASETSSPVTASEQMWSPAALRAYLDSDGANDVRDLILLVHDTSDVKDLPQNHELVRGFSGDRQRLDGMSKRLDDLLGEVLSRRSAPAA